MKLMPQQRKVLNYIKAEMALGRGFPNMRQISVYMGWKHPSMAANICKRLAAKNWLIPFGKGEYRLPSEAEAA